MSWMILVTCLRTWRTNWTQCSWRKSVKAWQTSNTVPLIVELLNYLSDCCKRSNIKTWQYFSDNGLRSLTAAWNHIVTAPRFYAKLSNKKMVFFNLNPLYKNETSTNLCMECVVVCRVILLGHKFSSEGKNKLNKFFRTKHRVCFF